MTKAKRIVHVPLDKRDPATVRAVILARESDPGSAAAPLESQVAVCQAFVKRMGWPAVSSERIFIERRSGYYNVERPGLDAIEALIQQQQVDAVIVLNFERLARKEERRYAALYTARRYGVEYRFAELPPDGKLDESPMAKAYASLLQVFGEEERNKIVARTRRGRAHRASLGLPSGGRGGAPYGLRKAQPGEAYSYWMENEAEAAILRWMFETVASDENASSRTLAKELNTRGILTREGKEWTTTTVTEKLQNPLYCGRGKLNKWVVEWQPKTNPHTGETYDVRVVRERTPDDDGALLPIQEGMLPVLIAPEMFDRVQSMIAERRTFYGRVGRATNPAYIGATLLDGGLVRCAHCHHAMVRNWRTDSAKKKANPVPYYRCGTSAHNPVDHTCTTHLTPALPVDALVLKLLAFALTDPEKVVELADAAEQRLTSAEAQVELATTRLESYTARLALIEADRQRQMKKIHMSDPSDPEEAEDIARYRERIKRLDEEQAALEADMARVGPKRDRAAERAALLRQIANSTDILLDLDTLAYVKEIEVPGPWHLQEFINLSTAAQLLGVAEDAVPGERRVDYIEHAPGTSERNVVVRSRDVVECVLRQTPRDTLRRTLRDLGVVVEINRPRPVAERQARGLTPIEERVTVYVGPVVLRALVRTDCDGRRELANSTKFAMPTMSTPAAQRSG